ncbi:hypothetical protein CXG81DRAFT_15633, partial [Caulochytrium protostelioides]
FNTAKSVKALVAEGFTPAQADAILGLVAEAIRGSADNIAHQLVKRSDQEQYVSESNADFAQLRQEINALERKDFSLLRSDLENMQETLAHIRETMRDEISRVHGGVRLDINLEKSRIQDETKELDEMVRKVGDRIDEQTNSLSDRLNEVRDNVRRSTIRK